MTAALNLAERGLGDTWPNPSVGCILVKGEMVLARGVTQSGGRPHAEQVALQHAGDSARGATAYVTLEPCSHRGKTPPCADALIAAGVARVVVGATDLDPRVSGAGILKLRNAGITADGRGPWEARAQAVNRGFFLTVTAGRPLITLKTATGLDGRIAMASGESRWITGPEARQAGHLLRSRFDAILVGSETALADDPELTCRLEGYGGRPKVRVVLDRRLRLPARSKLAQTAKSVPTWVMTTDEGAARGAALADMGVELVAVDAATDGPAFMTAAVGALAKRGLTRVLVEGGGQVAASLLAADLVDEVAWFRAGRIMGDAARPAVSRLAIDKLADTPRFNPVYSLALGPDWLDMLERNSTL
ncbi:MAG: bifunctional diaminohydroxyphosphoribosylaminopyrimidine deaminase/5-amino-6-(5-phosphoribosylamino)uracil reductase RibD [Rhodospirillaceae bacterium]|nr:MAG: bifunctional diaminohydroxyphosphoribosylaminopyrimidine deaminase/5-amino-6-(5-phosphoribosylamino)uracil reductase RibD [Rhodospirillaceae bacterium]